MTESNLVISLITSLFFLLLGWTFYRYTPIQSIANYLKYRKAINIFKTHVPCVLGQFKSVNPYKLSTDYRETHHLVEAEYTFGEIDLLALFHLIAALKPTDKDVFYDLGCGLGVNVIMAGLCFPFQRAVGIEKLPPLYQAAQIGFDFVHSMYPHRPIELIEQDLLNTDLGEATFVFINSTAMAGSFWTKVERKLLNLKPGTKVILTSHQLPSPEFLLLDQMMQPMNWGLASTFVYLRTTKAVDE